jgi:hypothetical protein
MPTTIRAANSFNLITLLYIFLRMDHIVFRIELLDQVRIPFSFDQVANDYSIICIMKIVDNIDHDIFPMRQQES